MRSKLFISSLLFAVACTQGQVEAETSSPVLTPPMPSPWIGGGRETAAAAPFDACPGTVWVGYIIRGTLDCPAAAHPNWNVSKLFSAATPFAPELERFCRYQWTGGGVPVFGALPNLARMRLERDCRVVVPLGQPTSAGGAELAAAHREALNLPQFPPTAVAPAAKVRIAVVDGSPHETQTGRPSGTGHGLAVGAVAHRAGCMNEFGGSCPYIASHQALRFEDYGYQSDVARAMFRAMRDFQIAGTEDRLIINLSLGWDPSYGSGPGANVRVPSYAVHTMLQVAACEEVLVIAAAGNRSRVDQGQGPILPAGWEPDARACPGTLAYSPLVHAIGGVTPVDEPIALSRSSSRPRLAAPATLVTASLDTATYSDVLSGTSMAAASAAGVAAMVWSFSPADTPEMVMDGLYQTAVQLGIPADFEHEPWSFNVARIDACAAVAGVAPAASQPNACVARAAGSPLFPDMYAVFEAEAPGLRDGPTTPGVTAVPAFPVYTDPDIVMSPWAGPQPTKPPCPLCALANNGAGGASLYGLLEIAPGSQVDSLHLRACEDECDNADPVFEVTGNFVDGLQLKFEIEGLVVQTLSGARLEAMVLDTESEKLTLIASEVLVEL